MGLNGLDEPGVFCQLPRSERVALAARCGRVAVRLLKSISVPSELKEMESLETMVGLLERGTEDCDLSELGIAMRELRPLAFAAPAECRYQGDGVVGQVAHAAYAAGMTAFTGSSVYAEDALKSALAAARTARCTEAVESLQEELRRVQAIAVEAADLMETMNSASMQFDLAIA